ncbi:phosphonate C-P lyase system protein PhnH [Agrobacterium sp. ES01]|uniref:phosphonate C-P lyase system protein PhnH n=1 Tax=Agrobacterium sp. ES01 TaxID=3420714 RepID=UPI003D14BA6A
MDLKADALTGGFSEPVFHAQSVFRMLMDCMARPGKIETITPEIAPPMPLGAAAGAVALSLCDHDTPVWLTSGLSKSTAGEWIRFHTGAALTREKSEARFAFMEAGAALTPFGLFAAGSQEYPDRSTTLVIEVARLDGGQSLILTGPGIKETTVIAPRGLPEMFQRQWGENRTLFPRGIDVVLTSGRSFLCLPRTCKMTVREN